MEFDWRDLAFHREIGSAIDALDGPHFWARLTRVLERHIGFDSWVALRFARHGPPLVCAEQALPDGKIDLMFQDYLAALYQLDPFYLAAFEQHLSGFFTLADVAPDNFRMTEYYQRYFKKNIVGDEVHFNVVIDTDHTLGFSLGNTRRYDEREIALLTLFSPWVLALMQQRLRFESFVAGDDTARAADAGVPDPQARFGMLTGKSGRGADGARNRSGDAVVERVFVARDCREADHLVRNCARAQEAYLREAWRRLAIGVVRDVLRAGARRRGTDGLAKPRDDARRRCLAWPSRLVPVEPVARYTHAVARMQIAGTADVERAIFAVAQMYGDPVTARRRRAVMLADLIARHCATECTDHGSGIASMSMSDLVAQQTTCDGAEHRTGNPGACRIGIAKRLDRLDHAVLRRVTRDNVGRGCVWVVGAFVFVVGGRRLIGRLLIRGLAGIRRLLLVCGLWRVGLLLAVVL